MEETLTGLLERLGALNPAFLRTPRDKWHLWLLGILYRYRIRGALYHPFLKDLPDKNFWGKTPFGKVRPDREIHPPAIRYRPHLLTTEPARGHEHLLATLRGNNPPWPMVWSRRVLGLSGVAQAELLDALRGLLISGEATGLFILMYQRGSQQFYAINSRVARLYAEAAHFACSETNRDLIRPLNEAEFWKGAPSLEYAADHGTYESKDWNARQRYYQHRYARGALRRVVANEHTGLLSTKEREALEKAFKQGQRADDPNVITCTSTLELGIDIGDLSTTMLCSIPPSTASYLQRIGRAGRATGASFIISIVNQRPHDLFFYARPREMLKGRVDPPGCWLDASAVLARQYLGFCLDTASATGILKDLPRTAGQLVDDLERSGGHLPKMLEWLRANEPMVRQRFLSRFQGEVLPDTRLRFTRETDTELLLHRIHQAAQSHEQTLREINNAQRRLRDQLKNLDAHEEAARREIEGELKLLSGRRRRVSSVSALELLTDHGLLPNYAFPERGVPFYGAIYNRFEGKSETYEPIEVQRPAGSAIRELAPGNIFYTHSRQFPVQQIAIGTGEDPLIFEWAVCGKCGHMRKVKDLDKPDAPAACPQCGHTGALGQTDTSQHRPFLHFPSSCAISFQEQYESLSADRKEERERAYYQVLKSFDHTIEAPSGAVGDDETPFGIEYRGAMIYRDINTGYLGRPAEIPFGPDQAAPEEGFLICAHCGVAAPPGLALKDVEHRRNCSARRKKEKALQQGREIHPFKWRSAYLYRELTSEAIRLLLPVVQDEDLQTLNACFYLGLRLRFEGDPAHLIVAPQVLPDLKSGVDKHFLVLMDAVPGGSGYLKTLYQDKDDEGREGAGIMTVMRLARDALVNCSCRKLHQTDEEQGKGETYDHVLVDEVQDFSLEALRLIRALSVIKEGHMDPLCTVGDGHQRVYGYRFPLSRAGINIVGRSRRLKVNYRTSEEIRKYAQGFLQGVDIDDLDGGDAETLGDHSAFHGPAPKIVRVPDDTREAVVVVRWVQDLVEDKGFTTSQICMTPYKKSLDQALNAKGIPVYQLAPGETDPGEIQPGVRTGSMKRIKGLEYRAIAMACADPNDPMNRLTEAEIWDRCERYVAATRTREYLLVTLFDNADTD